MNRICVYGLYRKGGPNYTWMKKKYGLNSILYIKSLTLKGWKLYDYTYYPSIQYTGDKNDTTIVDLIQVDDDVYKEIKRAEDGLCFFEDTINIDYIFYSIFLQSSVDETKRDVDNGDWIEATGFLNQN